MTTEYSRDKDSFFKWFTGIVCSALLILVGSMYESQQDMQKNITTLVAAQPFILSNVDDLNKKVDAHIETDNRTDDRQDGEIAEVRKLVATLPSKTILKSYSGNN